MKHVTAETIPNNKEVTSWCKKTDLSFKFGKFWCYLITALPGNAQLLPCRSRSRVAALRLCFEVSDLHETGRKRQSELVMNTYKYQFWREFTNLLPKTKTFPSKNSHTVVYISFFPRMTPPAPQLTEILFTDKKTTTVSGVGTLHKNK